jgi:hypothetical protein
MDGGIRDADTLKSNDPIVLDRVKSGPGGVGIPVAARTRNGMHALSAVLLTSRPERHQHEPRLQLE